MDAPSTINIGEYNALKYHRNYPDTPTYMQALSGENVYEYYKAMNDEIKSLPGVNRSNNFKVSSN